MTHLRQLLFPLAVYLGVTLGLPALNGAWQRAEYWTHASVVVPVSLGTAALFALAMAAAKLVQNLPGRMRQGSPGVNVSGGPKNALKR